MMSVQQQDPPSRAAADFFNNDNNNSNALQCLACGETGKEFSNRQRNRALMGVGPARCKECIQHNIPLKQEQQQEPQQEHISLNSHETPDEETQRLYFSDGESVAAPSSSSSSSDSSSSTTSSSESESSGRSAKDEAHDVSLNALKQQILGRRLLSFSPHQNTDNDDHHTNNEEEQQARRRGDNVQSQQGANAVVQTAASSLSSATADDFLKKELSCPICHEPFYQPKSLLCGHSFCSECLRWWLQLQLSSSSTADHAPENDDHANVSSTSTRVGSYGTCPTCRTSLLCSETAIGINTALRAAVHALYQQDVDQRAQAQREAQLRLTGGEHNGAHTRGFAILARLNEEDYKTLRDNRHGIALLGRRSVVLDEEDQRMQLALAVDCRPGVPQLELNNQSSNSILQVSLCLLTMEEDEVADSPCGFPLLVEDEDDEHLVCTEERFQSAIVATVASSSSRSSSDAVISPHGEGQQLVQPTAAGMRRFIGNEGIAFFEVDLRQGSHSRLPDDVREICFRHEETGAAFAIRVTLPNESNNGEHASGEATGMPQDTIVTARDLILDAISSPDDDGDRSPNEYEDDGFVVLNEDEEDERDSSDGGDEEPENDTCCICEEHGNLIVCDGGDHFAGCGKSFHTACVGRADHVPPGDWICEQCASAIGLDVGMEGHEFPVDTGNDAVSGSDRMDSDEPDSPKRAGKRILEDTSSEDESHDGMEAFTRVRKKSKPNNRARVVDSDSDDD